MAAEEKHIDIVFDGPPGRQPGRFVEVENEKGESIKFGEWVQREDRYWVLRIPDTLSIIEQAVGELKSAYEDGTEIDGLMYCDAEPDQAVDVLDNVLTRIKTLTETRR